MYRRLLLLQRLFQPPKDADEGDPPGTDDAARDMAVGAAVREVLDELTEHARLLTTIPFPLCEWRPGDAGDDQRWRALTEVERREMVSLVAGYDDLITWRNRAGSRQPPFTPDAGGGRVPEGRTRADSPVPSGHGLSEPPARCRLTPAPCPLTPFQF
jgi:hypothetical protein